MTRRRQVRARTVREVARAIGPRAKIIAIDGNSHAGKTTLAHNLGWQLGADVLHLDDFMRCSPSPDGTKHDWKAIRTHLRRRGSKTRKLIIEGFFMRMTLDRIPLRADCHVFVAPAPDSVIDWILRDSDFKESHHLEAVRNLKDMTTEYDRDYDVEARADIIYDRHRRTKTIVRAQKRRTSRTGGINR